MITHVEPASDWSRVHRLLKPVAVLTSADKRKLACGRTYHVRAGCAGYEDFPENHSGMCEQCRRAQS